VSHTHTRRCSSPLALAAIGLCLYLNLYLYLILFLAYLLTVCLHAKRCVSHARDQTRVYKYLFITQLSSVSNSNSYSNSYSIFPAHLRFGSAGKSPAFPRVFSLPPESFLIHRHFVIQQPQSWDEITPEPPPAYSKSSPAQPQTCLGTIIVFFPIRNGLFEHASVVCLPSASIFISN
jgi:hypothetical protein